MNEIHWKRGIPTEQECRECWLFDGSDGDQPEWSGTYEPKETNRRMFGECSWYAAVRILPPEDEKPLGVDPGEGYRLLKTGDTIQANDEYLLDTSKNWKPIDSEYGVGMTWNATTFKHMRRKVEPAEDPEEWVTQDRVPARVGIDERRWIRRDVKTTIPDLANWKDCFEASAWFRDKAVHGFEHPNEPGLFLELRCRRKDLPTAEPVIREFRNTEPKPEGPQPGQWWQTKTGHRRLILAVTTQGDIAVERPDGSVGRAVMSFVLKTWTHLPDCTGWDWQPPKKTKTQRKWVPSIDHMWISGEEISALPVNRWSPTEDVREVPL